MLNLPSYLHTAPLTDIQHEAGFSYKGVIKFLLPVSIFFPIEMSLVENDKALPGPFGVDHDDIRNLGEGRYSFWKGTVYFSTPDNSDPRNNGRIYRIQYTSNLITRSAKLLPGRAWRPLIYFTEFLVIILRPVWRLLLLVKRKLRTIIPHRLIHFARRVLNRLYRIDPKEDMWSLFYLFCFFQVLLRGRVAKRILKTEKTQ